MVEQQALELLTRVLRTLVRMVKQLVGRAAASDGHHQCVHDQCGIAIRVH